MERKVPNLPKRWCARLLILFAAMAWQFLSAPARDIALAAEEAERSAPLTPDPGCRAPTPEQRSTVILVYHHVRQSLPDGSRIERRLTVTTEMFDQQMRYLQENGYHVITFATLIDSLKSGSELPEKSVIISFDDGSEDQFEYALPALEKYHYRATFFVVADYVGSPGFLSWLQLQRMRSEGMEIGSHSRSHPHLDKISNPNVLWDEIYTSKRIIENQLGVTVEEFAYPYGSYDANTVATVRLAGYKAARACCVGQVQTDEYALRAVMAPVDLAKFVKYLHPGSPADRN